MGDIFFNPLQNSKEYIKLKEKLDIEGRCLLVNGLNQAQKAHISSSLFKDLSRPIVFIGSTEYEARKIYEDLKFYIKDKVELLTSDEIRFYYLDAKDRKQEAKRIKTLLKLAKKEKLILVTTADAVLRKYLPKDVLLDNTFKYKVGDIVDIEELSSKLVSLGYERVSKVEGFGQFSVRGGIVDIFSLEYENPIRI